jgi:hypothetical protein
MTARSLLVFLLRLGGTMTVLAFPAMLLPPDWMAATHRWLGMGELPEAPVVDYLARSVSALYGFSSSRPIRPGTGRSSSTSGA